MGRRRNRKLRRKEERRLDYVERRRSRLSRWDNPGYREAIAPDPDEIDPWALAIAFGDRRRESAGYALTCATCFEFVPSEGGRGTCLHPASGVHAPWTDTPACPFFTTRRHTPGRQHWE